MESPERHGFLLFGVGQVAGLMGETRENFISTTGALQL